LECVLLFKCEKVWNLFPKILFPLACNQGFGQFLNIKNLGKFSKKLTRLVEFIQEKQKFPTFLFEKIIVCNQGFCFSIF
jgi:hypothetical protein